VRFVKYDKALDYAYKAASLREMVFESLRRSSEIVRAKNIELTIEPMASIPLIVIDEAKIQFVIDTIMENALKYTPPLGKIHVVVTQTAKSIVISISDSGVGIKPSDANRIFKRFYRTENAQKMDTEGLGLGLYTAKRIIADHKGKISIKSAGENKGTAVTVEIPKTSK
jgi:signal transduction histidine kinase